MAQSMVRKSVMSLGCVVVALTRRSSSRTLLTAARPLSTKAKEETQLPAETDVKKSVFISQSHDIFTNLAMETWLYQNFDFTDHHVLMAWRNDPCVVIGRNQNPWLEANVAHLVGRDVPIARRNSGGGAVYHDRGNLNLSFFTPRARYDRRYNLEIITRALFREFSIRSEVNERKDIVVRGDNKVSGTAAKLGHSTAYHHCTLLVNANKLELRQALAEHETGIATNATASIRSPVANLCEENGRVTVDSLQTAVGWEFLRTPALHVEDGGQDLISKQRGFQLINPKEEWFPGLNEIREELVSWNWRYGKTPTFSVKRSFIVPSDLFNKSNVPSEPAELQISMKVEKGLINDVTLSTPPGFIESGFHGDASVVTHLRGKRFTNEALTALQEALQKESKQDEGDYCKLGEREQFVAKCFDQVVNTV